MSREVRAKPVKIVAIIIILTANTTAAGINGMTIVTGRALLEDQGDGSRHSRNAAGTIQLVLDRRV